MFEGTKRWRFTIYAILLTFGSLSIGLHELAMAQVVRPLRGEETRADRTEDNRLQRLSKRINDSLQELYAITESVELAAKEGITLDSQAPAPLRREADSAGRWVRTIRDADRTLQALHEEDREFYGQPEFDPQALQRIEKAFQQYQLRRDRVLAAAESLQRAETWGEMDGARRELQDAIIASWPLKQNRLLDVTQLPFRPKEFKSAEVLDTSSAKGKPAVDPGATLAASAAPTVADLTETIEIQFDQALIDYAARYNNDPIALYEQILSGFEFQPYYGSQKGALEAFNQRSGNDVDLSSLLITLFRIADIPARYARVDIEIPIQDAMDWLGVDNVDVVGTALATAGYPGGLLITGNTVTHYRITDYTVVKAYLPNKYRGAGAAGSGSSWIYLDPTFKQHQYFEGVDMQEVLQIDTETEEQAIEDNIDRKSDYSFNFAPDFMPNRYNGFRDEADDYFDANLPGNPPFGEVYPYKDILPESFEVLPVSLPYALLSEKAEHSEFPDSLRHKITFELQDQDPYDILFGGSSTLRHTFAVAELVGKRVIVAWEAASAGDRGTLNRSGGITNVRPSAVRMRSLIRVNDKVAAQGSSSDLGATQTFNMRFTGPGVVPDTVSNDITVGSYNAVIIAAQGLSPEVGTRKGDDLNTAVAQLGDDINNATGAKVFFDREDLFGEYLNLIGVQYFSQQHAYETFSALDSGIILLREVSEAIVTIDVDVSYTFGIPWALSQGGQGIDVDRSIIAPIPRDGVDDQAIREFVGLSGFQASTLEHSVFDDVFQSIFGTNPKPYSGVKGATSTLDTPSGSAVKLLARANEMGIPIYSIDSVATWNAVRGELQVSSDVASDIFNAVNAGQQVTIPQRSQQVDDWYGTGYVITDPNTGAGAYRISGGTNGGFFELLEDFNNALFSAEGSVIVGGFLTVLGIAEDLFTVLGKLLPFVSIFLALAGLFRALADAEADGRLCPAAKQILKEFLIMVAAITILFTIIGLFLGPLFAAISFIVSIYLTIAVEILKATLPLACNIGNLPDFKTSLLRRIEPIQQMKWPPIQFPQPPDFAGAWS